MINRIVFAALACACLLVASTQAKDIHAPLPTSLMSAKTVYIDNRAASAEFADRCYSELTKWGRFKIVQSREGADVVFLISSESHEIVNGAHSTSNDYGTDTAVYNRTVGTTTISILDRATGGLLWIDSRRWGFRSATKGVVKELRRRMEEQAKP
jgi:hypothetical protein